MASDRCRVNELRSAVSALQAKIRDQEGLVMDLEERLATRESGAHERLRVVEASMAALRLRMDLLEKCGEETLEAKNFRAPKVAGTLQRIEAQQAQLLEAFEKGRHERSPRSLKEAQERFEEKHLSSWAREFPSATGKCGKLLDAPSGTQLEKRMLALEVVTEDAVKRLRSDLNRALSMAKANGTRLDALEAKEEPMEPSRILSCVEGAAQVATRAATRAFASLDGSVKSMELQVSSITTSLTACGEEQQRQAAELKQLGHQVAHLEKSGINQEQLQAINDRQLQIQHDLQASKQDFASQMEDSAEQKEAMMQGLQDGKLQLANVVKSMASLRAELGERHTMLEERLSRIQSRVAQEIGEQRVRTESRFRELEEEAARANMAKDAEIFAQKLEEVEAMQKSMEYVEKRLHGVSKCLQTLYRKVGLSAREALAVQDMGLLTESEDVWVGPGFCHLRSPRTFANFGPSFHN